MHKIAAISICVALIGCVSDPNDPKTWIKKLSDPRESKTAVTQLVRLKNKAAVAPLIELYKKNKDLEVLRAIASFRDPQQVAVMTDALEYSEESFETASLATNALGETPDPAAVDSLVQTLSKPLPVKSRANVVKVEAMKALMKIGDKRAVPALVKVLETPADDQDFYLNQVAAQALVKIPDGKAIPALIRGLFMTGRGANIFQDCRAALLANGEAAVDPLVETFQRKNAAVEEDAKKYEFVPGIVQQKTAIVLGDLRAKKAVPLLVAELGKADEGAKGAPSHPAIAIALGLVGDARAKAPLLAMLQGSHPAKERVAAAEALNLLNDTSVLPDLLRAMPANIGTLENPNRDAAEVLAATVTAYSRLVDKANADKPANFPKLNDAPDEVDAVYDAAKARIGVASECKEMLACYQQALSGKSEAKSEKAAFFFARKGKESLSTLAAKINHPDPATRMAVLYGIAQTGDKTCDACKKALEAQIENDRTKAQLRPVVDEMRATLALISSR